MLKIIVSITASFAIFCLLALALIISISPAVQAPPAITPEDISKLKKTIAKSNPFKYQRYKHQSLVFDEKLLNQSVNFALAQTYPTPIKIKLKKNIARTAGSIKFTNYPIKLYLNFSADVSPSKNLFTISNIQLGMLAIPEWIVNRLTPLVMRYAAELYPEYINILDVISKIEISPNKLVINYHWHTGLSKKLKIAGRNFLLPPHQQKLLAIYYQALGDLSQLYFWRSISVSKIIGAMFNIAKQRAAKGADPIKENEAAILALGIMASGIRANHLLQDENAKPFRNAYFFRLSLLKRRDLMQHFLISAALAVSTNKILSDSIGLSKEMDDSKGGSGFSFADLLADRAGVRLAQLATKNASTARKVQQFLSRTDLTETHFMPPHDHLPESISELEFKNRYVDIRNQKYLFVERELQRRIASRPIYQFIR